MTLDKYFGFRTSSFAKPLLHWARVHMFGRWRCVPAILGLIRLQTWPHVVRIVMHIQSGVVWWGWTHQTPERSQGLLGPSGPQELSDIPCQASSCCQIVLRQESAPRAGILLSRHLGGSHPLQPSIFFPLQSLDQVKLLNFGTCFFWNFWHDIWAVP